MKGLAGKSIIVTGGGSGIGRAAAILLAEAGAKLTIADLSEDGCRETVAAIAAQGGEARWIRTDVTAEEDMKAMVDHAVAGFGGLHGACNSAGIGPSIKRVDQMTLAEWNRVIGVNLTGTFLSLKYQIPAILASGGGSIVVVASTASLQGYAMASDYCASKSALLGLVRAASNETVHQGLRINAVLPGTTLTPLLTTSTPREALDHLTSLHPIGRLAEAEEIGTAIRWLLSAEASFVSGAAFPIDGGATSK